MLERLLPPKNAKTTFFKFHQIKQLFMHRANSHFCFETFTSNTEHTFSDVMAPNVDVGLVVPCYKHNKLLPTYD